MNYFIHLVYLILVSISGLLNSVFFERWHHFQTRWLLIQVQVLFLEFNCGHFRRKGAHTCKLNMRKTRGSSVVEGSRLDKHHKHGFSGGGSRFLAIYSFHQFIIIRVRIFGCAVSEMLPSVEYWDNFPAPFFLLGGLYSFLAPLCL